MYAFHVMCDTCGYHRVVADDIILLVGEAVSLAKEGSDSRRIFILNCSNKNVHFGLFQEKHSSWTVPRKHSSWTLPRRTFILDCSKNNIHLGLFQKNIHVGLFQKQHSCWTVPNRYPSWTVPRTTFILDSSKNNIHLGLFQEKHSSRTV
jgi:hypothetical protein